MNKKQIMEAMKAKLDAMKAETDAEKFAALQGEFAELKASLERLEEVERAEKAWVAAQPSMADNAAGKARSNAAVDGGLEDSEKAFAAAARKNFSEGVSADGGYTVPEDIRTSIEKWRDAEASLRDLVSVEKVKTLSGQRTFQKRGRGQGFGSMEEGGKLPKIAAPKFERIRYEIRKYGGYMFATNELLEDTDAAIKTTIIEWFGENMRVTDNRLILAALDHKYTRSEDPVVPEEVKGLDDLKRIGNVKLGQTFAPTSKIVTNDDGLQWLDTLKDADGRALLKAYEGDPLKQYVAVGTRRMPVVIIPNDDLPTDSAKGIPIYMGDFKAGVRIYDRKQLSIMASTVAAVGTGDDAINAFDEDLTIWRGILREDVQTLDEKAWYKGFIKSEVAAAG